MAVEEARHVLTGDWIAIEDERWGEGVEVTATEHAPGESRLCCLGAESQHFSLVFLPDDPVMVLHYADEEETP